MPSARDAPLSKSNADTEADSEDSEEDSDEEQVKVVRTLDRCLRPLSYLRTNHIVHKYFRQHAKSEREDGRRCISPEGLVEMSPQVAKKLGVPADLFRGLATVFERFDFDGDGLMDMRECTSMYRKLLRQRRKELGGRKIEVEVPLATLEDRGYSVQKELGRGGQGIMYLCRKRASAKPYCVKFYSKDNEDCDELDDIIEEYAMMKGLNNEHIAKTYEVFQDEKHYYLVNEPYFGGDLTKLAKRAHDQKVNMSESWWRRIFWQCLDGLKYLHSKAIIHCDIKEPNIMVASGDDYTEPRIVLIDFGLAAAFSTTNRGASGTPGYIPPETHESGWWYPRGDIFSMGITFFQLMIGQVPRDDNSVVGVLQVSNDTKKIAEATQAVRIPWDRFPGGLALLRDLVIKMTLKDRHARLNATQALDHEWFESTADAELPCAVVGGLLGTSASHCAREKVIDQLSVENNLYELRTLHGKLREMDSAGQGALPSQHVVRLLQAHGASKPAAVSFTDAHTREDGTVEYHGVLQESIRLKERYSDHFIKDLFDELDTDGSGAVSPDELQVLLESDAFECPTSDIEDLMAEMELDHNGMVTFDEFRRAVLEDGRIGRRSSQTIRNRILSSQQPCCYCS